MVLVLWAVWRYFTPCIAPPSRTTWHLTFCNQSTTVFLNFWSCLRRMTFCPFVPAQRGLGDYLHARHGLQDSCVVKSCHRDDERLFWLTRIRIHGTRYWQEGRNVIFLRPANPNGYIRTKRILSLHNTRNSKKKILNKDVHGQLVH